MPKASEVAAELRSFADRLDADPDVHLIAPELKFWCSAKSSFLAAVRFVPRPATKRVSSPGDSWARLRVEHITSALEIDVSVPQNLTCTLITPAQPAVYDCEPILSLEEDAELEAA